MKKVSKIIALSLAILMLSGVAVFAAESITGVSTSDSAGTASASFVADNDVKVTITAPIAVDQVTVVVYKGDGTVMDDTTIAYIDQKANTTGSVDFTFKMRDGAGFDAGPYTVKVGGTSVTAPNGATTFGYARVMVTGYKVSGTVGPLQFIENPESDEVVTSLNNYFGKAKIELMDTEMTNVLKSAEVAVTANPDGTADLTLPFELTGVADGSYILALSRTGMASKLVSATVNGADVAVGSKTLLGADTNADMDITPSDVIDVLNAYKAGDNDIGGANYSQNCDVNGDGSITPSDVIATLAAYQVAAGGTYHEVE